MRPDALHTASRVTHPAHHPPDHLGSPEPVAALRDADFLPAPARAGIACVLDAEGRVVTLAATADLRTWARDRLAEENSRPRADLSAIATALRTATVGSAFEADWLYLELGRVLIPRTYRAAADRWQAWYLRLDPTDAAPTWRKAKLHEFAEADPATDPATLIGPFRDKDAAARFGELLDDAFELCRYPKELAQAPAGTACAYKQMGRCPAACDGSEPIDAYQARVRDALDFARDHAVFCETLEIDMRAAATAADFEAAAAHKATLDRLAKANHRAFAHATTLDRGRWLLIAPSERTRRARLTLAAPGVITPIADVDPSDPAAAVALARELATRDLPMTLDPIACERTGLLAHTLYHRPARARGGFVALHHHIDDQQIARLVRDAAKVTTGDDPDTLPDREASA